MGGSDLHLLVLTERKNDLSLPFRKRRFFSTQRSPSCTIFTWSTRRDLRGADRYGQLVVVIGVRLKLGRMRRLLEIDLYSDDSLLYVSRPRKIILYIVERKSMSRSQAAAEFVCQSIQEISDGKMKNGFETIP